MFGEEMAQNFHEGNICPTVKHREGLIMFLGRLAADGTGKNAQAEGRMDSTKFQQILDATIEKQAEVKRRMAFTNL